MAGLTPQVSKLYPAVQFPVSRGTPSISPLVSWDHTENWHVINDFTVVSNCSNITMRNKEDKCGKFVLLYVIKKIFLSRI
jgi:hypothetical protein